MEVNDSDLLSRKSEDVSKEVDEGLTPAFKGE
jgi:hypothetical protein